VSVAPTSDILLTDSFRGVPPFILSDFIRVAILVAFPALTRVLVRLMY